jgi:hypothetical protein
MSVFPFHNLLKPTPVRVLLSHRFASFGLVGFCSLLCGCVSDRVENQIAGGVGSQIADAIVTEGISPPIELGRSVEAFRKATNRWPKDYEKLSDYVKKSGTGSASKRYDQIVFTEKPDGGLEIYATAPGVTNRMTFSADE